MNEQTFELLQAFMERTEKGQEEIRSSLTSMERILHDQAKTFVRQEAVLNEHIRRTEAVETLVEELRTESKETAKTLRAEMEKREKEVGEKIDKKMAPLEELHRTLIGAWTFIKWVCGGIIMFAGVFAALKAFGVI